VHLGLSWLLAGACRPALALFVWLIIRLIQLVFSAGTVFFSHKKSANSVFQPAYNSSRTAPLAAVLCLIDAAVSCLLLLLIHVPSLLLFDDKQAHTVEVYVHNTK
jgi:hypothetical protein